MTNNGAVSLIKEEENRLYVLEEIIELRLSTIKQSADDIAVALYEIQQDGLWMHKMDDSGIYFKTFDAYLRHLADEKGGSRSSFYDYKRMVLIAVTNGIAESPDDFARIGVSKMRALVNGSGVQYDRRTGQIIESDDGPTAERIRQIATQLADTDLPPREVRAFIQDSVEGLGRTEIRFDVEFLEGGGILPKWIKYESGRSSQGYMTDRDTPQDVIDKYLQDLHIHKYTQ